MKGIILAGGAGTRLHPLTQIVTKQLLPVYEKPMVYYPLSTLMLCGIRDLLFITTPSDREHFEKIFGNGEDLGLRIQYAIQAHPDGLPESFVIGEDFIAGEDVVLILGDNIFHGDLNIFRSAIQNHFQNRNGATLFAYKVTDPERYGVIEFCETSDAILSIEEKPQKPRSAFAIPGFYIFDKTVSVRAKQLKPSSRGETEIVDLIKSYMREKSLVVSKLSRSVAWLDTGTPQALLAASQYIAAIEQRQGLKVACIEEVAFRMNFISKEQLAILINKIPQSPYRDYLWQIYLEK